MKEAIDPVCEMTVDVETAPFKAEYNGVAYFFCAAGCLRTFQENPAEFVA
ncbi:MAG TPA: YHS domain-containing protein [Acidimicrobiia bacterium]|nr:YHS domain-containing protein [Acidimicrobiia bacterium]